MNRRGQTPFIRGARAAQDALVADAAGDAVRVERLEQPLRVLARDPQPVAQLRQRHAAGAPASSTVAARACSNASAVKARSRPARTARPCSTSAASAAASCGSSAGGCSGVAASRACSASTAAAGTDGLAAGAGRLRRRRRGGAAAGRGGIGHGGARHGDLRARQAHDQAIAGRGGHLPAQPQLRVGLPSRSAPRSPRAGPRSPGASAVPWWTVTTSPWRRPCPADASTRSRHVEPVGVRQRRPAWPPCARAGSGRARRRRGRAATRCPAAASSTAWSCTWTLRTRTSRPPGSIASRSPTRDRARPQRARDDGADAAQREGAVDRQPHAARRPRGCAPRRRRRRARARSSSRPAPVRADTSTIAAPA